MKFSIIIPVFQGAGVIITLLDLLCEQKNQDVEIIIVDDGSTDDLSQVLEEFHSFGIRYIRKDINEGVSAARNIGLSEARGEYVVFLDCDDKVDPAFIKTLSEAALEEPDADIILYGYQLDFPSSHQLVEICDRHTYSKKQVFEAKKNYGDFLDILIQYNLLSPVFNIAAKRSFLLENHLTFDEEFSGAHEDELWKCDMLQASKKAMLLPDILYRAYISMEESCATQFHEQELDALFQIYKKKIAILQQFSCEALEQIVNGLWVKQVMLAFANLALHPKSTVAEDVLLTKIEALLNDAMFFKAYTNSKEHALFVRFFVRLLREKNMTEESMNRKSFILSFFEAVRMLYENEAISDEIYEPVKERMEQSLLDKNNRNCVGLEVYENFLYINMQWSPEQIKEHIARILQKREA